MWRGECVQLLLHRCHHNPMHVLLLGINDGMRHTSTASAHTSRLRCHPPPHCPTHQVASERSRRQDVTRIMGTRYQRKPVVSIGTAHTFIRTAHGPHHIIKVDGASIDGRPALPCMLSFSRLGVILVFIFLARRQRGGGGDQAHVCGQPHKESLVGCHRRAPLLHGRRLCVLVHGCWHNLACGVIMQPPPSPPSDLDDENGGHSVHVVRRAETCHRLVLEPHESRQLITNCDPSQVVTHN